ncbi:MAG: WecB/TagA/CpsF family glycosyltransferase [Sulfitobacter sp.]
MKFGAIPHAVDVNIPTTDALFRTVRDRLEARSGFALATLNLDHLTKLPRDPAFLAAYRAHELVVADGRPVVWLSQLARQPVELMPGSDLIIPLCALCSEMGVPIAMVGSSDAALDGAATALRTAVPGLKVAYVHAPPYGFDPAGAEADALFDALEASGAGLCFVALGAPKQELFAARGRDKAPSVGFASIGAGLDFLAGHQVRAPRVMRMLALEWLWRALQSPMRMVPRYAKCFAILPGLVVQAIRARQTSR